MTYLSVLTFSPGPFLLPLFDYVSSSQPLQPNQLDVLSYCAGGDSALYFTDDYFPKSTSWECEATIIAAMLPDAGFLSDAVEGIALVLLLSHPV